MEESEDDVLDTNQIRFYDGQLSCIGQDWCYLPSSVVEQYRNKVIRLDLSFNNIDSLQGIDNLPCLEELVLDNNNITDDTEFPNMPKLHTLTLNKNQIQNLEVLLDRLEQSCVCLTYLSLLGNVACPNQLSSHDKDDEDYQRYRYYVLYRLSKLKFLDSTAVRNEERLEAERRGQYLRVVRPSDNVIMSPSDTQEKQEDSVFTRYTPLPQSTRDQADNKATFGRCKYVYYGRHSEGNRFIRNNDL